MKQSDIKAVKQQLTLYGVPQASLTFVSEGEKKKIHNSDEMASILEHNWEAGTIDATESFYVALLDRSNSVKGIVLHSKGGLTGTVIDTRTILAAALLSLSSSIIVAHNHPSGNTQPSDADIKMTKKLKLAAEHMEIKLLDHIIITKSNGYFSFTNEGLI